MLNTYILLYTGIYLYIPGPALYVLFFGTLSSLGRKQHLKTELGTSKPTVFQGDIMMILLNAVRIRWNYNNSVLCM